MIKYRLKTKIKKELSEFKKFKSSYKFLPKELETDKNGAIFCDGVCIREAGSDDWLGESETFINVGYKIHGPFPKVLSNLFPYEFYFKGFKVSSVEAIFQGLKFKNKKTQRLVFLYFGLNSNNIKVASDYNWKEKGKVYFQGKEIERQSKEYEDFVDGLYISLLQNQLFRNCLKNVQGKYILHAMGETDKTKTLFSREEFEFELNCLKDFVQSKENVL